jgi:hypothetical protein
MAKGQMRSNKEKKKPKTSLKKKGAAGGQPATLSQIATPPRAGQPQRPPGKK